MPHNYICPYCEAQTEVSNQFSGQQGHCATCGKPIKIPEFESADVSDTPVVSVRRTTRIGPRSRQIAVTLIFGTLALLLLICGSLFVAFFLPGSTSVQAIQQATACQTNLQQLYAALEAYRAVEGTYPPAYTVDKNNQPMHSWRVLILPYLNLPPLERAIVNQYDFGQPWDSPANTRVAGRMPTLFQCPADGTNVGSDTNYVVIVGKRSAFRPAKGLAPSQITDDLSSTVLVVETAGQMVPWTKPTDITTAALAAGINSSAGTNISSSHPGGAHALMADGTIRFLPQSMPITDVQGMTTIDGDEFVPLPK